MDPSGHRARGDGIRSDGSSAAADDGRARLGGVVLDCIDPVVLARFWSAALDYREVTHADAYVRLRPEGRPGPQLLLQRVPEPKAIKNRMHLDLDATDIEVEADRLAALGARRLTPRSEREREISWITMVDPEGNEFCVCEAERPEPR